MASLHGDDYPGLLKANFSSNIWHGADNSALYDYLAKLLPTIQRYPEIEAESLKEVLAAKIAVSPSNISIGNGSIDIIYRIAQCYQGSKSVIISPTFSEYSKACYLNNHTVVQCKTADIESKLEHCKPDLVWLCNPNNPDGNCMDINYLKGLLEAYPQVMFIIDQSFAEFTLSETLAADSVLKYSNLILIYSLTKRYAIPGLRIGYVAACESIIAELDQYRIPWSVNTLAIEAAKYLLSQNERNHFELKAWLSESLRFQNEINKIGIYKTVPSKTPFFIVELIQGKAAELKKFLLKSGLLIRDANNFEYKNYGELIRLNTLTEVENNALIDKLTEWKYTLLQ